MKQNKNEEDLMPKYSSSFATTTTTTTTTTTSRSSSSSSILCLFLSEYAFFVSVNLFFLSLSPKEQHLFFEFNDSKFRFTLSYDRGFRANTVYINK